MGIPVLAANAALAQAHGQMKTALILLAAITALLIASAIAFTMVTTRKKATRSQRRTQRTILRMMYTATGLVLICTLVCSIRYCTIGKDLKGSGGNSSASVPSVDNQEENNGSNAGNNSAGSTTVTPSNPDEGVPEPSFTPEKTESSDPEKWEVDWEIIKNGTIVDSYKAEQTISFGAPEDYFALPGIATFRGNNFRNSAVYGTADVELRTLDKAWTRSNVGSLNGWPGVGWTGQPLMVQWPAETKAIMNLYPEKKDKEGLVEVIYATLDGHIYFYDLEDGSFTRDPINAGMNFKGAGALDPRGYPIMYVGSGDYIGSKVPKMYIISLIDGQILYQYGHEVDGSILYERTGSDAFSTRNWAAFDSSPLVDKETDTLIWPGESGVLYTIKLNTSYDPKAGVLSIDPEETVKTRYTTKRSNNDTYWIGYEPSAVIVDRYLYISENGGMFFCIDLDTMSLVWAQDTRDDSNSTPVFEWNGVDGGYIYTAPSLHWTASGGEGYICIYKLNAKTGEIVWEKRFDCHTVDGVSGGVQSSPLLGKPGTQLEGLIIYTIARTPSVWDGKIVAISTQTGEIVWEKSMDSYTWSSPVAVYDKEGTAYIIYGDSVGNLFMVDYEGNNLSKTNLGSNIEASPAVYENTLVVGTRGGNVCGIKIK